MQGFKKCHEGVRGNKKGGKCSMLAALAAFCRLQSLIEFVGTVLFQVGIFA